MKIQNNLIKERKGKIKFWDKNIFSSKIFLFLILVLLLVIAGCTSNQNNDANDNQGKEKVTIFKSMTCGCCDIYTQYMDKEGYNVEINEMQDISPIKSKYNIPSSMQSCHTTVVGNYFVEGHIPVEAIEKLLAEKKPNIAGIAMPGMPSGSPGMPGAKTGPFIIYAVHADGTTEEFMRM